MDPLSIAVGGALGAGLASLVCRSREDRPVPAGLADVLQWGFLAAGPERAVVLNKDGALLAGWRYYGPDVASASGAELEAIARQVNDALLPFADGWMWHVDAVRRPAEPYPASAFPAISPGTQDVSVPAWIDAERRAAFAGVASESPTVRQLGNRTDRVVAAAQGASQFVSEYTLTLTYLPPPDTHARAARLFVQPGDGGGATNDPARAWCDLLARFNAQVAVVDQRLGGRFHLERLDAATLVSHLHTCLTTLTHPVHPPPVGAYLNAVLASQELVAGFVPRIGRRHLVVVAVEGYPDDAPGARLDFLNALAVPYRWSSRFIPLGQRTADTVIRRQRQLWFAKRRDLSAFVRDLMSNAEKSDYKQRQEEELFGNQDATAMLRDLNAARSVNASGAVRFGYSTQIVVVADEDVDRARAHAAAVTQALHDHGFTARVETVNAPEAFIGSLPGHGYQNLRRQPLHSANLADLWPLTSIWPGLARNPSPYFPAQSPPLMHVATDGSTPFRLNLHVGDVGHTLVVGSTGGGKSTLLGLVMAQWQRYGDAQTVVFDYDYSHWLLAKACGAQHYDLCAGRADTVAFQPLADVDEPAERAWAGGWLEVFLEIQGVPVTPARRVRLARALSLLAEQPREHRTLSELVVQVQDPELRAAFSPYLAGGTYGQLFDASGDAVGEGAFQVFELKHLLALGEKVVTPAFLYLAHRIERKLTGRPTLTVVEELHALLGRHGFPDLLRTWLLTQRKRNGAVVLVFHSPAQLDALPVRQVIVESCPTRILLPNAEAGTEDNLRLYRELGLSDREVAIVAGAVPKRDYFVRTPIGSRLVRLDLGPVAHAFLGTPAGLTPDVTRAEVAELEASVGGAWPRLWLTQRGIEVPEGAVIRVVDSTLEIERATPSASKSTIRVVPAWERDDALGSGVATSAPAAPRAGSLPDARLLGLSVADGGAPAVAIRP